MPVRRHNAQAILAAPRSRILHRCRAAPERRPRASERDPRAKNPFLTPTAPLSASRQPSPRPPRVSRRRLVESCARGGANGEGDLGAPAFRVPALRCAGPEPRAPKGCRPSPGGRHPLTICRLTHAPPNKRRLISNPPRPGEPGTRLSPLTHPIPSPVTQSRKSSSSHARATPTSVPLPPASRVVFRRVFLDAASRAPTPPTCF